MSSACVGLKPGSDFCKDEGLHLKSLLLTLDRDLMVSLSGMSENSGVDQIFVVSRVLHEVLFWYVPLTCLNKCAHSHLRQTKHSTDPAVYPPIHK
jgi:hypothetical protein